MSDFRQKSNRIALAEFMVGKAIGVQHKTRSNREEYNLKTTKGITISVRSSTFLETWHPVKISTPKFWGLKTRAWDPETGFSADKSFRAKIFVFALQTSKHRNQYDALNVSQWKFWLASRSELEALNQDTCALNTIETNFGSGFPYAELLPRFRKMTSDLI